jgi:hypothetical protein
MRTMLLAAAVILTMRTLVLATASSMVMATAGTVFAERASVTFQKLAMAPQIERPAIAGKLDAVTRSDAIGTMPKAERLAQGWHPAADSSRSSAA